MSPDLVAGVLLVGILANVALVEAAILTDYRRGANWCLLAAMVCDALALAAAVLLVMGTGS